MSWDITKHSINSQIGNPLDKQLEELLATLKTGVAPVVKSVQRGTYSSSGTVTISAVDVNKSIVIASGDGNAAWYSYSVSTEVGGRLSARVTLTNSTTLTITNTVPTGVYGSDDIGYAKISWQVIEFY